MEMSKDQLLSFPLIARENPTLALKILSSHAQLLRDMSMVGLVDLDKPSLRFDKDTERMDYFDLGAITTIGEEVNDRVGPVIFPNFYQKRRLVTEALLRHSEAPEKIEKWNDLWKSLEKKLFPEALLTPKNLLKPFAAMIGLPNVASPEDAASKYFFAQGIMEQFEGVDLILLEPFFVMTQEILKGETNLITLSGHYQRNVKNIALDNLGRKFNHEDSANKSRILELITG